MLIINQCQMMKFNSLKKRKSNRKQFRIRLNKRLGSLQQLGEKGVVLAGGNSPVALRDSKRLSSQYGGGSSDWAKFSSSQHISSDGRKFETHWMKIF